MAMTNVDKDLRFTHVHRATRGTPGKGRLVATIATRAMPDGTLAVAVARVNLADGDAGSRFGGRARAEARLSRFVAYLNKQELSEKQQNTLLAERTNCTAFLTTQEDFKRVVMGEQIFSQLAGLDHTQASEVRVLLNKIRAISR